MDALKIQTEMLKKAYKTKGLGGMRYGIWDDEHIALVPEGHYMAIVPKSDFYLDINAIWENPKPLDMKAFKENINYVKPLVNTMTSKAVDKWSVRIFKPTDGNYNIYIDERILKLYETKTCTFKGTDSVNPVFVFEDDEVVGMMLPVHLKKGDE